MRRLAFLFDCTRFTSWLRASLGARLAALWRGSSFTTYRRFFTGRTRTTRFGGSRFTGGFTFFGVLLCTLSLDARFGLFKLLTGMIDMLLLQLTARVPVKVNALCANFNAVQITPARSIEAQGRTQLRFAKAFFPLHTFYQILKNADFQRASFALGAKAEREALGKKSNDFFTRVQLRLIFHEIS
jgi:hypothetical protein